MELSRHKMRAVAFQTLFALTSNPDGKPVDVYEGILGTTTVPEFLSGLVAGVLAHQTEIDQAIIPHLAAGWSLERLNKVDLNLLRLATYEIKYCSDVPDKVAVNEALQLAKEFSDDQSRRFINGVLAAILKD